MSAEANAGLRLGKCSTCHARFVPVDGPCPRCASTSTEEFRSDGVGKVLASTALEVPPPGFDRPHLLAIVEVEDGVRLLVVPDAPLPEPGALVEVRLDAGAYRCRAALPEQGERGEGDVPKDGANPTSL